MCRDFFCRKSVDKLSYQFPLKSTELVPGSPRFNEYISVVDKVSIASYYIDSTNTYQLSTRSVKELTKLCSTFAVHVRPHMQMYVYIYIYVSIDLWVAVECIMCV